MNNYKFTQNYLGVKWDIVREIENLIIAGWANLELMIVRKWFEDWSGNWMYEINVRGDYADIERLNQKIWG